MYLFIRITYHIRSYAVLMMFVIDHSNLHTAVLLTTVWLRVVLKIDMKRYRSGTSLGLLRHAEACWTYTALIEILFFISFKRLSETQTARYTVNQYQLLTVFGAS